MNKLLIIIKREYLNIVKKKSFLISALLTPVFMIGLIVLPSYLARVSVVKERNFAVIDQSGFVLEGLQQFHKYFSILAKSQETEEGRESMGAMIEEQAKQHGLSSATLNRLQKEIAIKSMQSFAAINFEQIPVEENNLDEVVEGQLANIRKKKYDVLLVIPSDVVDGGGVDYYSTSSGNFDEVELIRNFVTQTVTTHRLQEKGLDPVTVQALTKRVPLNTNDVTETGVQARSFMASYLTAIAFVFLLFMAVMQTGQQLFRGVLEEKNNRIIEVLLSSITPKQLMGGKIIGLGAAGLTLVVIWVGAGFLGLNMSEGQTIPLTARHFIYFVVFFVLGYLLYSTFMAILGAVTNSEQEAQQFITIISLSLMFPMLIALLIYKAPNSTLSVVLSFIPILTPTMIIFRTSITTVPLVEIVAAVILMIFSIWFMISFTSKIFRIGILMYGKKPSIKEIRKWMKYQ